MGAAIRARHCAIAAILRAYQQLLGALQLLGLLRRMVRRRLQRKCTRLGRVPAGHAVNLLECKHTTPRQDTAPRGVSGPGPSDGKHACASWAHAVAGAVGCGRCVVSVGECQAVREVERDPAAPSAPSCRLRTCDVQPQTASWGDVPCNGYKLYCIPQSAQGAVIHKALMADAGICHPPLGVHSQAAISSGPFKFPLVQRRARRRRGLHRCRLPHHRPQLGTRQRLARRQLGPRRRRRRCRRHHHPLPAGAHGHQTSLRRR